MSAHITRPQMLDMVHNLVIQSQLLPDTVADKAEDLSTEELEKLTITLHTALKTEQALSDQDKAVLTDQITSYFDGKSRIYTQAQKAWLAQQEARHEHQESLFEEALLQQL